MKEKTISSEQAKYQMPQIETMGVNVEQGFSVSGGSGSSGNSTEDVIQSGHDYGDEQFS